MTIWRLRNSITTSVFYSGIFPTIQKRSCIFSKHLKSRKKALGEDHPDVGHFNNNLAILSWNMGNFHKAESYYLKALEIKRKALGEDRPDVADFYNNLGILYMDMGNYTLSELFHLKALDI